MPKGIPSPVSVVAVNVPASGRRLPVASTLTMSMPRAPLITSGDSMAETTPPVCGARLPTLITSRPSPLTVVGPLIVWMLTVAVAAVLLTVVGPPTEKMLIRALPEPALIVVVAPVETTLTVSWPAPPLTFVVPRVVSISTRLAPLPHCTLVVPVSVLAMVKNSLPWPRATFTFAIPL